MTAGKIFGTRNAEVTEIRKPWRFDDIIESGLKNLGNCDRLMKYAIRSVKEGNERKK